MIEIGFEGQTLMLCGFKKCKFIYLLVSRFSLKGFTGHQFNECNLLTSVKSVVQPSSIYCDESYLF